MTPTPRAPILATLDAGVVAATCWAGTRSSPRAPSTAASPPGRWPGARGGRVRAALRLPRARVAGACFVRRAPRFRGSSPSASGGRRQLVLLRGHQPPAGRRGGVAAVHRAGDHPGGHVRSSGAPRPRSALVRRPSSRSIGAVLVSPAPTPARAAPARSGRGRGRRIGSALSFAGYLLTRRGGGPARRAPGTVAVDRLCGRDRVWTVLQPWSGWPFARLADPEIAVRVLAVGLIGTLLPFRWPSPRFASSLGGGRHRRDLRAGLRGGAGVALPRAGAHAPQLVGGALVVAGVLLAQVSRRDAGGGPGRTVRSGALAKFSRGSRAPLR